MKLRNPHVLVLARLGHRVFVLEQHNDVAGGGDLVATDNSLRRIYSRERRVPDRLGRRSEQSAMGPLEIQYDLQHRHTLFYITTSRPGDMETRDY
jgi:hypothetical protein